MCGVGGGGEEAGVVRRGQHTFSRERVGLKRKHVQTNFFFFFLKSGSIPG